VDENGWLVAANRRAEALGHEESSSCVAQGFSPSMELFSEQPLVRSGCTL
jgi:hypothetical protein